MAALFSTQIFQIYSKNQLQQIFSPDMISKYIINKANASSLADRLVNGEKAFTELYALAFQTIYLNTYKILAKNELSAVMQ